MSGRLRFEWIANREGVRNCFLGEVRVGFVRKSSEGGFVAVQMFPGSNWGRFPTIGEAEADVEKLAEDFVEKAGLVQKDASE